MSERDCNNCVHHKQGEHPPAWCRVCLNPIVSTHPLPLFEAKEPMHQNLMLSKLPPDFTDKYGNQRCSECLAKAGELHAVSCSRAAAAPRRVHPGGIAVVPIDMPPLIKSVFTPQPQLSGAYAPAKPLPAGLPIGPTRATTLPEDPKARKTYPIASGVLDYFPDAIVAISHLSHKGNEQHNPGKPLHWDRTKSLDHADTAMRHFMQRGTLDTDGVRHTVKAAWRILAALQTEIENEQKEAA